MNFAQHGTFNGGHLYWTLELKKTKARQTHPECVSSSVDVRPVRELKSHKTKQFACFGHFSNYGAQDAKISTNRTRKRRTELVPGDPQFGLGGWGRFTLDQCALASQFLPRG